MYQPSFSSNAFKPSRIASFERTKVFVGICGRWQTSHYLALGKTRYLWDSLANTIAASHAPNALNCAPRVRIVRLAHATPKGAKKKSLKPPGMERHERHELKRLKMLKMLKKCSRGSWDSRHAPNRSLALWFSICWTGVSQRGTGNRSPSSVCWQFHAQRASSTRGILLRDLPPFNCRYWYPWWPPAKTA